VFFFFFLDRAELTANLVIFPASEDTPDTTYEGFNWRLYHECQGLT